MAVMRTTQPAKVQQALGRQLSAEEAERLAGVLPEQNEGFKSAIRQQVDEGATSEERWNTIRDFEARYVQLFRQTFGMTEAQFDMMLAPDSASRPGPAVPVPLPAQVPLPPAPAPAARSPVTEPPLGDPNRKPAPAGEMTPVAPPGR